MVNNSDGLTPTLRPQLGVGWNRALPAPFGFDNGIQGDGVNDNLSIINLTTISYPISVEFWINYNSVTSSQYVPFFSLGNLNTGTFLRALWTKSNSLLYVQVTGAEPGLLLPITDVLNHFVFNLYATSYEFYKNGVKTLSASVASSAPVNLNYFKILKSENQGYYNNNLMDEFRIYKKALTQTEVSLNYNNGIGNNPCETEHLLAWYKFEQFENLDFSPLQDNSDIRLGIRDLSGKNNHAQPLNMDTNPASPNYVLKPFL